MTLRQEDGYISCFLASRPSMGVMLNPYWEPRDGASSSWAETTEIEVVGAMFSIINSRPLLFNRNFRMLERRRSGRSRLPLNPSLQPHFQADAGAPCASGRGCMDSQGAERLTSNFGTAGRYAAERTGWIASQPPGRRYEFADLQGAPPP